MRGFPQRDGAGLSSLELQQALIEYTAPAALGLFEADTARELVAGADRLPSLPFGEPFEGSRTQPFRDDRRRTRRNAESATDGCAKQRTTTGRSQETLGG